MIIVNDSKANNIGKYFMVEIVNEITGSEYGSLNDFLKVGIYEKKSTITKMIIEYKGLSMINQRPIETNAKNKDIQSDRV